MNVYSIGYQGASPDSLSSALVTAGVRQLIDVRAIAWSQRPQFRKTALATALAAVGIEYVHCKSAGNPYRPVQGQPTSWEDCALKYTRHLEANRSVVDDVLSLATATPSALFCFEAQTCDCHRGILLSALESRGLNVVDLRGAPARVTKSRKHAPAANLSFDLYS